LRDITSRQQDVLDRINQFYRKNGYAPSVRDLANMLGVSSISTIHQHLAALETKGYIKRNPNKARSLEIIRGVRQSAVRTISLPFFDDIDALLVENAVSEAKKGLPLPPQFIEGDSIVVKVKDDEMTKEGIHKGDLLIVRLQQRVHNNDIILLKFDKKVMVRRLHLAPKSYRLTTGDNRKKPMLVRKLELIGKVITGVHEFR